MMTKTLNFLRLAKLWLVIALALGPLSSKAECPQLLESIDRLQSLVGAENTARDALVTIRRNSQDWKNLLLRGRDASERKAMQTRFDTQVVTYAGYLSNLRSQLSQLRLALDRLDLLEREQLKLFEKYRAALVRHGVDTLEAAAAADREVQGADVLTFRILEQTIEVLSAGNQEQFKKVRKGVSNCQALLSFTQPVQPQ
jgi:hypothetical protein